MALTSPFLCLFVSILLTINPVFPLQHYDNTKCTSEDEVPGSNYLCRSKKSSCDTFIIYRAQENYNTLTSISSLLNTTIPQLLSHNNMSQTDPDNLKAGREIIVPVTCSCPDRFSESIYFYNASKSDSLSGIACDVFEGLVKAQSLIEDNPGFGTENQELFQLEVPIKCACPDESDVKNGTTYLVTYPVTSSDNIYSISLRFGVSEKMIMEANGLDHLSTIFPKTTLLIPTKDVPVLNPVSEESDSGSISPNNSRQGKGSKIKISIGVIIPLLLLLIVSGVLILLRKKYYYSRRSTIFPKKNPLFSNLSPDLLDGMSKLKNILIYFSLEEIRTATKEFAEDCLIGSHYYRGKICDSEVAVEEIDSLESARSVLSILTKINHINVVKLIGFCLEPKPYLVYEFMENFSLKECLSNPKIAKELNWKKRLQIAIDVAVGLHYIHDCTSPSYIHQNINSKTILISKDHRAKISGFKYATSDPGSEGNRVSLKIKKCMAPEYLNYGDISTKVDVYAYGLVLLELLSGKEVDKDGITVNAFREFPELRDSLGYSDTVKRFMDPVLGNEYALEEAMRLFLLAKGCVEEVPLRRPSINHVLKTLFSIL